MIKTKHTYILLILAIVLIACKQTKYVPDGQFLLKKNEIIVTGDKLEKDELNEVLRQQPNYKRVGVKWKLMAYNLVDSAKVANKRLRKNQQLNEKNNKIIARQTEINTKRIAKSRRKNRTHYTEKIIPLKDTISPRKFLREWYKYKIGKPPVVFDSALYSKSINQLEGYLKKKGYYYGEVKGFVDFKKNRKCVATYHVVTGEKFVIDSVYMLVENDLIKTKYKAYLNRNDNNTIEGLPFDSDLLDYHRYRVAKYMRNQGVYGFSSNHIKFYVDTNRRNLTVNVGVHFGDRYIQSQAGRDSVLRIKHQESFINKVIFHVADSIYYEGSFKNDLLERDLSIYDGQFLRTIDTTYYAQVLSRRDKVIDPSRTALILHNGPLHIKPQILEAQNYLEIDKLYSEWKLEQTYLSLLRLDLFQAVKTELVEYEGIGCLNAHYYLIPSKKQTFGFEPRATNSNGFLGVAATINYINRNLFRGAEKLTVSLSGGFESQPPVFDETIDGEKIKTAGRSFNTFEIGPSVKLQIPGLFPLKMTKISKKLRPRTIISTAYNFQKRTDFTRGTFQMNYTYQFHSRKTMIFEMGLPGLSAIKFVNIDKSNDFESKLTALNDLFLLNTYSNQFIWQDFKFKFEYNIKEKEKRKGNSQLYFSSSFDPAGNIVSLFQGSQDTIPNGQYGLFGIAYAQFTRLDNELIFSKPLGKEKSFNFRAVIGGGLPYGNTKTSLPYDYSFFAGGANDNRGWRARSLGPGSYKYYLDTNRSATQVGDLRLGSSAEFRFAFTSLFKGALFVDAGNVWTALNDPNRVGGQVSKNMLNEIAFAAGFGLRLDLDYFIVRVDIGFPLKNPALPKGSQWIFQSRQAYLDEGLVFFGANYEKYLPKPFVPSFNFGIGYPF